MKKRITLQPKKRESFVFNSTKRASAHGYALKINYTITQITMKTTQKTLNALIYTLGVLLAGSLGALLMFLAIDV